MIVEQETCRTAEEVSARRWDKDSSVAKLVMVGIVAYLLLGVATWKVVSPFIPAQISMTAFGHAVSIDQLHRRLLGTWLIMVGVVPAIFVTEIFSVGWRRCSLRHLIIDHTASSMSDLACFVCTQTRLASLAAIVFSVGTALISGAWIHDKLSAVTGLSLSLAWAPLPIQIAVNFTIYTFFDYWDHRFSHARYFWPIHRYHHSADEFYVVTSDRTHPAVFLDVIALILPAAVLSLSVDAIVYVNMFVMGLRYVIHSRIDSDFGWIGRYLLQSPVHHRLHHVLDTTKPTANFSLLPIWDRLFGTWRDEGDQSVVIGVDTPYRHGAWFIPDQWRDYCDFWKGLTQIRGAASPAN